MAVLGVAIGTTATAEFRLGVDYSKRIGFGALDATSNPMMAADGAGALYILDTGDSSVLPATAVLGSPGARASYVMKRSPAGDRIAYLTVLGFPANAIAVDSSGSVYLAGPGNIGKLNAAGTAFVYQMPVVEGLEINGLAADDAGHAYVIGQTSTGSLKTTPNAFQQTAPIDYRSKAFVAKVNAAGTAFDYATYLAGIGWDVATGIAVDGSGAAFVTGTTTSADFPVTPGTYLDHRDTQTEIALPFLTRLSPDGSKLIYSTFTGGLTDKAQAVAVDPRGNAVVYQETLSGLTLLHFDPQGKAVTFSKALPSRTALLPTRSGRALAMDAAGNTYATGFTTNANYPVKSSLVPCGSMYLTVFGPSGDLLQSTYLAGGAGHSPFPNALVLAPNSVVYVLGPADPAFDPGPEPGAGAGSFFLTRLSLNETAQPVKLACLGNAGSYDPGAVAPGEIVSLFGESLGPDQGMQPVIDPKIGFPTVLAGVQVTFDHRPAPLLYVQYGQINAIAPWALAVGRSTEICVFFNGAKTNCLSRPVAAASPGVFTVDGFHAAALNQDGTINSAANPAPPGSIVSIFATGLGPITPQPNDGAIVEPPLPVNVLPTKIGITGGGAIAQVFYPVDPQYAGPAPSQVAGVSQINVLPESRVMFLSVGHDFFSAIWGRSFAIYGR